MKWELEASVQTWEPPTALQFGRDGDVAVLMPRPEAFQGETYALKLANGSGYVVHLYWVLFDQILAASVRLSPTSVDLSAVLDGDASKYAHRRFDNAYVSMVYYMRAIMEAAKRGLPLPTPPEGVGIIDDGADFPKPATFRYAPNESPRAQRYSA